MPLYILFFKVGAPRLQTDLPTLVAAEAAVEVAPPRLATVAAGAVAAVKGRVPRGRAGGRGGPPALAAFRKEGQRHRHKHHSVEKLVAARVFVFRAVPERGET